MTEILIVTAVAALAGIVQGVTGFGSCIVMMMALPYFFALPPAAGISVAVEAVLCLSMVVRYRRSIRWKLIPAPSVLYLISSSLAIVAAQRTDPDRIMGIFSAFLILLAVYFIASEWKQSKGKNEEKAEFAEAGADAAAPGEKARPEGSGQSPAVSVFCVVVSGVCDGMFGIGGPLMVLYYLSRTEKPEEYLGTIEAFFLVNAVYNTVFRMYRGILGPEHLMPVLGGMAAILAGGAAAAKIVGKLDPDVLRKLIYVMIGLSGVVKLL